jgi:putative tricarboxylic transport membrane protein
MAILMGAFVVHGLTPGPLLFRDHPDIAWAIIASLFVGNVILLVLNVPLIRMWLLILRIPYPVLFGVVLGLMMLGSYVVNGAALDILTLCVFGILGYWLRKVDIPLAPIALTMVLGPILETNLVRALLLSDGDVSTLWGSPFAAALLAVALAALALPFVLAALRARAHRAEQRTPVSSADPSDSTAAVSVSGAYPSTSEGGVQPQKGTE